MLHRIMLAVMALMLCWVTPSFAAGHGSIYTELQAQTGIKVDPLIHGQMVVMQANREAILQLADDVAPTDPMVMELKGYINAQYAAAWYGLAPLALAEVESPFHMPTHAYLAGSRVLLLHLQKVAGTRADVKALATQVESEMMANNASMSLCRYSDTSFNTAQVLGPEWGKLTSHPPTLMLAALPMLVLMGLLMQALTRRRRLVALPA